MSTLTRVITIPFWDGVNSTRVVICRNQICSHEAKVIKVIRQGALAVNKILNICALVFIFASFFACLLSCF